MAGAPHDDAMQAHIQVRILNWAGNEVLIDALTTDTIENVKDKIYVNGLAQAPLNLALAGNLLQETATLEECGIRQDNNIYLVHPGTRVPTTGAARRARERRRRAQARHVDWLYGLRQASTSHHTSQGAKHEKRLEEALRTLEGVMARLQELEMRQATRDTEAGTTHVHPDPASEDTAGNHGGDDSNSSEAGKGEPEETKLEEGEEAAAENVEDPSANNLLPGATAGQQQQQQQQQQNTKQSTKKRKKKKKEKDEEEEKAEKKEEEGQLMDEGFPIFVGNMHTGKSELLIIKATDTIETVQAKIHEQEGTHPEQQVLCMPGAVHLARSRTLAAYKCGASVPGEVLLARGRTVAEYGIHEGAVILVIAQDEYEQRTATWKGRELVRSCIDKLAAAAEAVAAGLANRAA